MALFKVYPHGYFQRKFPDPAYEGLGATSRELKKRLEQEAGLDQLLGYLLNEVRSSRLLTGDELDYGCDKPLLYARLLVELVNAALDKHDGSESSWRLALIKQHINSLREAVSRLEARIAANKNHDSVRGADRGE